MAVDEDSLWADALRASSASASSASDGGDYEEEEVMPASDEEDDEGHNVLASRVLEGRTRIVRLPDGDIHVCDAHCPHTESGIDPETGRQNGDCVCKYTGRVVTRCCEVRTDASTGRSTWSCDPDVGWPPTYGGAIHRRDARRASMQAWNSSRLIADDVLPSEATTTAATATSDTERKQGEGVLAAGEASSQMPMPLSRGAKRTALCVDEVSDGASVRRLRTAPSPTSFSAGTFHRDAFALFAKLMTVATAATKTSPKAESAQSQANSLKTPALPEPNPSGDLMRHDVLFAAALRKYMKEAELQGNMPSVNDVNNISLAVRRAVNRYEEQREAREAQIESVGAFPAPNATNGVKSNLAFRQSASTLAVVLWKCASATPYMCQQKRNPDAFRPFCAGVFYALKRGIALPSGAVLVPRCEEITVALVGHRAFATNSHLKSLHASSHRGLCTLHRCIASVDPNDVDNVFESAVRCARDLSKIDISR